MVSEREVRRSGVERRSEGEVSRSEGEVGSRRRVCLPIHTYDQTVLVGVRAQDGEGRRGDMSNLVSVFVTSPPSTTPFSTTTTSTSSPSSSPSPPTTYSAATFWAVVGSLAGTQVRRWR